MKIDRRDDLACRLDISTGMSAFSWGEKVTAGVTSVSDQVATVSIQSGVKTVFGSATGHGKNRQNVRIVVEQTSKILSANGEKWRQELALKGAPHQISNSIADELSKLAELRSQGVLDDTEFAAAKAKLLSG